MHFFSMRPPESRRRTYLACMLRFYSKVHAGLFENQSRPVLDPLCAWEASIHIHLWSFTSASSASLVWTHLFVFVLDENT